MAKPDYATLLKQIAETTDPALKAELEAECYQFPEPLTEEEEGLFDFLPKGYVENNPGYDDGEYVSYAGVYISANGQYSGEYP